MAFFTHAKTEGHSGYGDQATNQPFCHAPGSDAQSRRHERPHVDIIGRSIALGPIDMELMALYQQWADEHREAWEFADLISESHLIPEELGDDFGDASDEVFFTVYELGTWRPIGGAALTEIDFDDEAAEFTIVIGEADCRGRGYGVESARLVLDYAFNALGLQNVMLRVSEFNYSARFAFENAGFREFSRRKSARLEGARLWDEIYMGCLSTDFANDMSTFFARSDNLQA